MRTTGGQTYGDAVVLGLDTLLESDNDVLFHGDLDSSAGDLWNLTVNAGGVTRFGDDAGDTVGGDDRLASITTDAVGRTEIGAGEINLEGASATFGDAVLLLSDVVINEFGTGDVHFASTVDSAIGAGGANFGLTVNTMGDTIFDGEVGGDALGALSHDDGLKALTTDSPGTTIVNGGLVRTTEKQTYGDDVVLGAHTVFDSRGGDPAAGGIEFLGAVDSDGGGPWDLTVRSDHDVRFHKSIGTTRELRDFIALVEFDGVNGLLIFGPPDADPFDPFIIRVSRDVLLNGDLAFIPVVATIGATGSLTIESLTNGTFAMGELQKMSILGDLLISGLLDGSNALGGKPLALATLSDINTLGNMTINSSAILILTRDGSIVRDALGNIALDQGVDFVAGGFFFFLVTPMADVAGGDVQFANVRGDGDGLGTLKPFIMRAFGAVQASDLLDLDMDATSATSGETIFFDLRAQGPTNTNVSDALAGAIPRQSELEEVSSDTDLDPDGMRELFERLAILVRRLGERDQDIVELLALFRLYDDSLDATSVLTTGEHRILVTRLLRGLAQDALATYNRLTINSTVDDLEISKDLSTAWSQYVDDRASSGEDARPEDFGAYLADTGRADSLNYLQLLAELSRYLELMGLTNAELRAPNDVLMLYGPQQWTEDEFKRALQGAAGAISLAPATPAPETPAPETEVEGTT